MRHRPSRYVVPSILLAVLALSGCGGSDDTVTPASSDRTSQPPDVTQATATHDTAATTAPTTAPMAGGDATSPDTAVTAPSVTTPTGTDVFETALPLALAGGQVVDAAGRPFLLVGDSPWSLIVGLDDADTLQYLDDRAARGFNALLVNLVEHKFAANAPANAAGDVPFASDEPFESPNEAYFDHAKWVVGEAEKRGIVVLLTAAYAGHDGGDEGWYQEMEQVGPDVLRTYGEYVGRTFADFSNIIWVGGGDYTPPRMDLVDAVQDGIKSEDPDALQTGHGSGPSAAVDAFPDNDWLNLDSFYAPSDVGAAARAEYTAGNQPFFLIEATYENESQVTTAQVREQAYAAMLNGAFGQVFGNNPIWHLGGPGLFDAPGTWQSNLDSPGSKSMTVLRTVFDALEWSALVPQDHDTALVTDVGDHDEPTSVASDGATTVAYVPDGRTVRFEPDEAADRRSSVQVIDPSNGAVVDELTVEHDGRPTEIDVDRDNADGSSDWLLVIRDAAS